MARQKKSSIVLEKAERRIADLLSIGEELSFGEGLTLEEFESAIEDTRQKLKIYNTSLSTADANYTSFEESEKTLKNLAEHMLLGVAVKYGKDSLEYEKAGGVRKSDRKRPVRKNKLESTS
jgi:exo-beta-1,3-glucanase (GH17 family)